jgi:phage shock protein C
MKSKRVYRSKNDKIIAGVCGGIAEYFNVDPVLIRIITVLLFFAWIVLLPYNILFGLFPYIITWIIIPKNPN